MGELGITIMDLGACPICGYHNPMIFQNEKNEKFWIACGHRRCEFKTKENKELLEPADEWGLAESE
jgi:hypothetical protein